MKYMKKFVKYAPERLLVTMKSPPKIIKWAPHLFAPILKEIFNKCIESGHYPDAMKIAKVAPIYKKGDKNDVNNYRPIGLLTL